MERRHPSRRGLTDGHGRWTGAVRFNEQWLDQPLRWSRPRRIFVCAHGDLFHEAVPDGWIDQVFEVMARSPWHVFQVLTKRPRRMRGYILGRCCDESAVPPERIAHSGAGASGMALNAADVAVIGWPLSNVWLGTSAEDQPTADERVAHLLATPAAVRWISLEPLLGPITLREIRIAGSLATLDALAGGRGHMEAAGWPALDWVVAGGESGPRARPMDPDWARSLRDQCRVTGVPFFFKQWGGATAKAGGRMLDGRSWDEMPAGPRCMRPGDGVTSAV